MSSPTIESADDRVPPLSLPAGALSHSDRRYEYEVGVDPPDIEPIEHQIRLDFISGERIRADHLLSDYNHWAYDADDASTDPWLRGPAKPNGLQFAEQSCYSRVREEERFFENPEDSAVIADAPVYLAAQLEEVREHDDTESALEKARERRVNWYRESIPGKNLYQILKKSSYGTLISGGKGPSLATAALTEDNVFEGTVVVSEDTDPKKYARQQNLPEEFVYRESEFSHADSDPAPSIVDFGIELPAPLLIGCFVNGSRYPFIPWGDGLTCSCPYKHDQAWRVMCKHELPASNICGLESSSIFIPKTRGIDIPHRARRFVSPEIAATHRPTTN